MTAPSVNGSGAALAMKRAIIHAGLNPVDIDYVNAHATSTPIGNNQFLTYDNNDDNHFILNTYHLCLF